MVCQILDVFNIHLLPYFSDPTDPITYLRPHREITPTPFGVATPGLGTPGLGDNEVSSRTSLTTPRKEEVKGNALLSKKGSLSWLKSLLVITVAEVSVNNRLLIRRGKYI